MSPAWQADYPAVDSYLQQQVTYEVGGATCSSVVH